MKVNKAKKILYILVILSFLTSLRPISGSAMKIVEEQLQQEVPAGECFSLDVVFLIDQSDSMSGASGGIPTDPTDQRVYAVKWAIDWLTDNAYDVCPDAFHRVAMISYGSDANIDLPLSNINPESPEDWRNIRDRLKNSIYPGELDETNPQKAFTLAAQVLDDAAPIGTAPRKSVVIFITDGVPCVNAMGCDTGQMDFVSYALNMRDQANLQIPFDSTLLLQEECLQQLRDTYGSNEGIPATEISRCKEDYFVSDNAYELSTYIWTILLNYGAAYPARLRDVYADMSETHGGGVVDLTSNRADIPKAFLEILTQLAGVEVQQLSCGDFAVNPFLKQARFVFFKIDEEIPVTLSYKDSLGNLHVLENGEPQDEFRVEEYSPEINERYVLGFPEPGIWHFDSTSCDGIFAYYEMLELSSEQQAPLQILAPDGATYPPETSVNIDELKIEKFAGFPYYDEFNQYYLQFTVFSNLIGAYSCQPGEDIVPAQENPFFDIQFNLTITDPDENSVPYEMEWVPDKCLYQTTTPIQIPLQGEYNISARGTVPIRSAPFTLDPSQTLESVFTEVSELFTTSSTFHVVCPGLEALALCPWAVEDTPDGCQVCNTRGFEFKINTPENGADLGTIHATAAEGWPLPINPIAFQVEFSSPEGLPFLLEEVLLTPDAPFDISVVAGGETHPVTYRRDLENPLRFIGEITDVDAVGTYELIVALSSDHNPYYFPVNEVDQRTFTRIDGLWNQPQIYYTLLAFVAALVIAYIVYQVLIRNNKVRGELVFRSGQGELERYSLSSSKNWKVLNSKQLTNPQLDLKKIKAQSLPKGKKPKLSKGQEGEFSFSMFDEGGGSSHPGVKVTVWTEQIKTKTTYILAPHQPQDYSDNSVASMVYEPPE